jgi:SAM-dependent methyltransferase
MTWIAERAAMLERQRVIEIGSLDVNGSVRGLFESPREYMGVDLEAGPSVDLVADAHDLPLPDARFTVGVCCEMLEHDEAPWLTLAEVRRVMREGAVLLLTCRGFDERGAFQLHEYPIDCVRFSVAGVRGLLRHTGFEIIDVIPDPQCPGVFAEGRAW